VALLYALSLSVPTAILVLGDMETKGKRTAQAFFQDYVPNALHILIPTLIASLRPLASSPLDSYDLMTLLTIYVPLVVSDVSSKYHLLYDYKFEDKYWQLREFSSLIISSGLLVLLICLIIRPLHDIGLGNELSFPRPRDFVYFFIGLVFAIIPLFPIGLSKGILVRANDDDSAGARALLTFATLYFFVSLPLDIFFRGFVQNLLHAYCETRKDTEVAIWGPDPLELEHSVEALSNQANPNGISLYSGAGSSSSSGSAEAGGNAGSSGPTGPTTTTGPSGGLADSQLGGVAIVPLRENELLPDMTFQSGRGRVSELALNTAMRREREGTGPPVRVVGTVDPIGKTSTILTEAESPKWPTWQQKFERELSRNRCRMFLMPTWKDWVALVLGACLYAGGIVRQFAAALDGGKSDISWGWCFGALFWDGLVRGYVWRMTGKVYLSALAANLTLILGFCVYSINVKDK